MTRKLLVIDDHPETVKLVAMSLRRHGYEVVGAQSGMEGIAMAEESRPDLVLLDLMMPDMDGFEVCRLMRANPKLKGIPIIMFTAKNQVEDKLSGFAAGADDYLSKPTRPAELTRRIEAILARFSQKENGDVPEPNLPPIPPPPPPPQPETGKIIAIIGSRGGAGTTTLAMNLATALAESNLKTALVDMDTCQGHHAVYLGLEPKHDINELVSLSGEKIQEALFDYMGHYRKLDLLLSHPNIPPTVIPENKVATCISALENLYDYAIIDVGHRITNNMRPILEKASQIILCLRPERASITSAKNLINYINRQYATEGRIHPVMLDFGVAASLPKDAVESFLGHPLAEIFFIPGQHLANAVNAGVPLVHFRPHTELARQFHQIAEQLVAIHTH